MKKVAILQSNYIPWKGYFDLIASVDEFIIYDDMQFTKRDWRNRNRLKTPQGMTWLTVPVKVKGRYHQSIRDTEIDGTYWADLHWKTIELNYRRANHFEEVAAIFQPLYVNRHYSHLSALNRVMIEAVCSYLGITTKITNSWDYALIDGKTERLVDLCKQAGGMAYITGPSARNYIREDIFIRENIKLIWFEYVNYPEYRQLWNGFLHEVTILDLLFNCGQDAPHYMRHVKP